MATGPYTGPLERVDENCVRIPKSYKPGMRVDGLIFADERLLEQIGKDQAPDQVANVATLPGIQYASLAMPDIHWGYGFCIGGVAATDPEEGGVISPGGVGYDINCGVRLVRTNLFYRDIKPHVRKLVETLFRNVPTGAGRSGKYHFDAKELRRLMGEGVSYVVGRGLGQASDIEYTEAHGRIDGADPDAVSDHAVKRGAEQCGTLGSGNHFLEIQIVDDVFDPDICRVYGLEKDQVCILIHSGSRGLGYQVCDDALAMLRNAPEK
jgi:tRNA-splicing ligase RtcB